MSILTISADASTLGLVSLFLVPVASLVVWQQGSSYFLAELVVLSSGMCLPWAFAKHANVYAVGMFHGVTATIFYWANGLDPLAPVWETLL